MATQTQGYAFNPAGFNSAFDYRNPPRTPGYGVHTSNNYSPRQYVNISTPSKGHTRRATGDGTTYTYTYTNTTPRKDTHHSSPMDHSSARPQTSARRTDYVPIYDSRDSRPRRSSYTAAKPSQPQPPPQRPSTAKPIPAKATEDDARRAGIPAGYSYKNWDPAEEPILLLGSVFDANSLGKWIYDWTVFYYGPATPMSDEAGELWLLLLALAHKVKRAEDLMPRIRSAADRDLVEDFLESGERLWQRFNKLLKLCENFMWKAAKRESAGDKKVRMGHRSGCEFVDAIFGRDRELDRTTKLMAGMRLWSLRFDANCEDILRNAGK